MKIAVVSGYNTENICGFKQFTERIEQKGSTEIVSLLYTPGKRQNLISEVKEVHPELLVTVDLAGFELCTLTDHIFYNLLDCKQLHLLFHEDLPDERYLNKQLSLAMFFYCAGDSYYKYLGKKYPGLPYLKELQGWQRDTDGRAVSVNAEVLLASFQEVLHECAIPF